MNLEKNNERPNEQTVRHSMKNAINSIVERARTSNDVVLSGIMHTFLNSFSIHDFFLILAWVSTIDVL